MKTTIISAFMLLLLAGCAPEIGSERWCAQMAETPKGDWTANDAVAYAKSCVFDIKE